MYHILAVRSDKGSPPWLNVVVSDEPVKDGDTYTCKFINTTYDDWDLFIANNALYDEFFTEPPHRKHEGWKIYKVIAIV